MRIALCQMALTANMEKNFDRAMAAMEQAAAHAAEIICFPEVQFSPFFPQFPGKDMSHYAIRIGDGIVGRIQERCRELRIVCVPNFYLQEGENYYDASPVIDADGKILGISKMVHIVQGPQFFEQDYYSPSDSGFKVYDTAAGRVGVVICFDRHISDSIRTCVLKGAQLIVVPTANTKAEPVEMFEWEIRVQAMQFGVFVAMCNRVGVETEMDFCGESIVVNPDGDVVSKADDTEQILYADLHLPMIEESRRQRPYLTLRRPEAYLI